LQDKRASQNRSQLEFGRGGEIIRCDIVECINLMSPGPYTTKGVGCHNPNLQHDTSQKPSEFPTKTETVRPSIYQVGVASI